MKSKAVLIVLPNAFKFGWMGSTKRLFSISNAFNSLDYKILVVAQNYENESVQRKIESEYSWKVLRTTSFGNYPEIIGKFNLLRRLFRGFWRLIGKEKSLYNISLGWANKLNIKEILNDNVLDDYDFKLVWGMSAGMLDGAKSASKLADYLSVPWVMELHDPPIGVDIHCEYKSLVHEFTQLLEDCSLVVPNTKSYQSLIIEKYKIATKKCIPIFMTYEITPQSLLINQSPSVEFVIGYVGTLNGHRTLNNFAYALIEVVRNDNSMNKKIKIELAGIGQGFDDFQKICSDSEFDFIINYHGQLDSKAVESLVKACDCLLIVQAKENNLEIPGKLFQMFSYAKPILGLMDTNSETANILKKSGLGTVVGNYSIEEIKTSILQLFTNYRCDYKLQQNKEFIEIFSEKKLHLRLQYVLDELN
ncbi:hypothetical protein H4J57_00400 [Colwellia sp. BRX8-7]|jgi:glycosyltransferase involved in cell wall biosynthesis|uniref:hypothetical protein n=1 Tax=Colwellia sp. BRX8-7 TaxID=2759833 RepID=UPI0015F38E79|nr:hypothetical protein [Colwellia sp. BRX8-7]MBA6335658.1 hypothetical protein [Colwellia sp. BRX8-7]